jgi:uridylate kinase
MNWLACPMYSKARGIIDAIKRPKYRLPISSFAIAGYMHWKRGHFTATIKKHTPNTSAMSTMLEPKTLPIDTPMFSEVTPKTVTLSSGSDVAKPTRMKPMVVFPNPVIFDNLTELLMVTSLAIITLMIEARRIRKLPISPNPSNTIRFTIHILLLFERWLKTFLSFCLQTWYALRKLFKDSLKNFNLDFMYITERDGIIMRIVLRIGGSVVASPVDTELMSKYAEIVRKLRERNHELAVVVGGGSLAREFISTAKNLGLDMQAQDEIAISVSRLFAQLFLKKLGNLACEKVALTLEDAATCLSDGRIVVMGGLKPGITTDAVAALVAEHVNGMLLVKGTDQEGIYSKDPRKYSDAIKLDHLSFDDLQSVFSESQHKAGMHQIVDPEAIKVLKRNRVKLVVVNGFWPENILLAVQGERVGTVVE